MIFKYLVQDSKQFFINNGRLILIFEIFTKKDLQLFTWNFIYTHIRDKVYTSIDYSYYYF